MPLWTGWSLCIVKTFTSNHTSASSASQADTQGVGEFVATLTVRSAGTDAHSTTQYRHHGIGDLAAASASWVAGSWLADATGPRSQRLGCDDWCFSCGKSGRGVGRYPELNETFLYMLPGWSAEKVGGNYMMISPRVVAARLRANKGD